MVAPVYYVYTTRAGEARGCCILCCYVHHSVFCFIVASRLAEAYQIVGGNLGLKSMPHTCEEIMVVSQKTSAGDVGASENVLFPDSIHCLVLDSLTFPISEGFSRPDRGT